MDFTLTVALGREGEIALLKAHTLMKILPEGFVLKSHAMRALPVDPALDTERVLEAIGANDAEGRLLESSRGHSMEALFRRGNTVLLAHIDRGVVRMEAIASDGDAASRLKEALAPLEKFRFENEEKDGVWIDLTYQTSHGVARNTEFIRCPEWAEIEDNYPDPVRQDLARLMGTEEPWKGGRLIIWHGPTGSGKTFALRSLLMAWRKNFDFLFVTDPEKLTSCPGYYYEVAGESLAMPKRPVYRPRHLFEETEGAEHGPTSAGKRSLFIFEDSADLIISESRSRHYDKIGKLLNMTDGLLGQGRQDVFLVTFNEQIDEIDPAFLRPGRCIASVQFRKFAAEAARAWLRRKGDSDGIPFKEGMTLAELYAMLLGHPIPLPEAKGIGRGF